MLTKRASYRLVDVEPIGGDAAMIYKTAATKIGLGHIPQARDIVAAEVKKHPTALFFKAKAIVADETNSNGDNFPWDELRKSYATFVGVPFYTNHNNQDVEQARGKIIFAELNEEDKAIYVVGFIDREAYPHICRGVEQEYMTGVSMGCSVEYSECSICQNKATTVEEYCNHVKFRKGRRFTGTAKNVKTGEVKEFKDAPVYEVNYGIRFIELSGVSDPACRSCHIKAIIDNDEVLRKAANVQNGLYMVRNSGMAREASQADLQKLDQILATLEEFTVSLVKNRKRVEPTFASTFVEILANLQEATDELVGAGYGQIPDQPLGGEQGVPGVPGTEAPAAAGEPPVPGLGGAAPAQPGLAATPMAAPAGLPPSPAPAGTVSGSPTRPAVSRPTLPTPPAKSMAADILDRITRAAESIRALVDPTGDDIEGGTMKRRTPVEAAAEREAVMGGLDALYKGNRCEAGNKSRQATGLQANGGSDMSDITKTAERQDAPERVTEVQLDKGIKQHPRTGEERNEVTQGQLDQARTGKEPEVTHERQIDPKRTDGTPDVLPEKYLDGERGKDEKNSVTQSQLDASRVGKEPEVVHEKQLDGWAQTTAADVFSRKVFARKDVKDAAGHVKSVVTAIAGAAVECGCAPESARAAVSELVGGSQARSATLESITRDLTDKERGKAPAGTTAGNIRFYGKRGIVVAAQGDLKLRIEAALRSLVAYDDQIHPDVVMDVLDVVSEDDDSTSEISRAIDEVMAAPPPTAAARTSMKADIRKAFKQPVEAKPIPEGKPAEPSVRTKAKDRATERDGMIAAVARKGGKFLLASLAEIGATEAELLKNDAAAKAKILAFVRKANAMKDVPVEMVSVSMSGGKRRIIKTVKTASKLNIASVVNVSIDGDVVQIAVETSDGGSVEIKPGEQVGPDFAPPEGDVTGENLDAMTGGAAGQAGGPAPTAPQPPPAEAPLPTAATKGTVKTAQFGGGSPGVPGAPVGGPGGAAEAPPQMPPSPAMDQGIQSLTSEEPKDEKKFPGAGEQIMPGAVCPICHSTDTTAGKEGRPAGQYECNQCGLVYEYHVNIEVLNPESMEVSEDGEKPGIKEPSLPEMPVAAMIDLDKGVMTKVAAAEKKYGHVCAACGMTGCKPIEQSAGRVVYVCPACETRNEKDVLVDSKDASKAVMRIAWTLDPAKIRTAGCDGCKAAALKFVAARKVAAMMKSAASTPFPMANCFERIAKKWGVNAVASYGPCKGKPLADCVCKQLAAFGMRDVGSMNRLAAVYTQEDPMEECVRKHMDGTLGLFTQAQAKLMCGALKRKAMADAATREVNENEFIMAFANGGRHSIEELRIMKQKWAEILGKTAQVGEMDDSTDIGAPIGDVPAEGQETVTIELPATVAQDVAAQVDEATKAPADAEVVDGAPKAPEAPVVAAATATVKVAAKPKVVEKIEGEVEAGIPRGNATIGNEKPPEAKNGPEIPRGDAKLGHEAPLDATLPDIPSDSEFIGGEAEAQKGMPAPDVKLKGTVIAEGKGTVKEAAKPTKVETIEKDVEAGVPRKNETLGNEGKKNIDVDMAKPKIPEGDAKMGGEAPPEATLPDIPADSAYMGGEAEAQKGMPGINTEIKGTVIAGDEARKRQIERIAAARTMKANSVLSRLMGEGRIRVSSQQEFERLATDLSQIPLDRIEAFAERLCQPAPVVKQASAQAPALAAPIVQEASSYVDEKKPEAQPTVVEQMRSWFTVGSKELDAEVRKQR